MEIRQAIGDRAGEAATWHQLATIDLKQGDYAAAREKFATSLQIKQAIGDRAGEAATWHQLATIDVEQGDYAAAREQLPRSDKQAIGDRAARATWPTSPRSTSPGARGAGEVRGSIRQARRGRHLVSTRLCCLRVGTRQRRGAANGRRLPDQQYDRPQ